MNSKIAVLGLVLALVIGFSTISYAGALSTGESIAQAGNFDFGYNYSASVLSNVSYSAGNSTTPTYLLAPAVYVNGSGTAGMSGTPMFPSDSIALNNGTVFSANDGHMLVTVGTGIGPSITYVTEYALAKVDFNINTTAWFGGFYNMPLSSATLSVYQMVLPDGAVAVLFSNSNSIQINSNTVKFNSSNPPLFVGLISKQGFINYIQSHIMDTSRFYYNSTTGFVDGAHASFYFNNSTISDFTSKWTNTNVFSSISVSGNGSLESNTQLPIIPFYKPIIVGGLFVYATNTSIYAIHDNPAIQSTFVINNGTITFAVPSDLNVTVFTTAEGTDTNLNGSMLFENESEGANMTMGLNESMEAGKTTIYIHNGGFRGMMFINGGDVSVNENLISVSTKEFARVQFAAPVGLQGSGQRALHDIAQALINNEVGSVEEIVSVNGTIESVNMQYNSSISTTVTNVGSGTVTLEVSSFNHRGNMIAVYISNGVFSNSSQITVTIDGNAVIASTVNGTISATSTLNAYYAVVQVNGGLLVLIHVPHFSSHSVEIASSSSSTPTSGLLSGNHVSLIAVGIGIVAVAVVALAVIKRKKP